MKNPLARKKPLEDQPALILWDGESEVFLWVKRDDVPLALESLTGCGIASSQLRIARNLRVFDGVNHQCQFAQISIDDRLGLRSDKVRMAEVNDTDANWHGFSQRAQVNLIKAMIVVARTLLNDTADQDG